MMMNADERSLNPKQEKRFLLLIFLMGALTRIYHLNSQSIWGDEAFTTHLVMAESFLTPLLHDVHPPLYFALVRLWASVAGISEVALRYLSVLPSMLSIAMIYLLAKELQRHHPQVQMPLVPLFAALFMALADMENYLSQEIRMYTMHVLIAIISTWAYWRWVRTDEKRDAFFWCIATTALAYTHYLGVLTSLAQAIHALFFLPNNRRRLQAVAWMVMSALLFLPWVFGVIFPYQLGKFAGHLSTDSSTWATLYAYRTEWLTHQWVLMAGLLLVGGASLQKFRRDGSRISSSLALLSLWASLPLLLAFMINLKLPLLISYRLSQITPPIVLLMAYGLASFRGFSRNFILVVVILYGLSSWDVYRPKPPWYELGQMVVEYALPGDAAVMEFTGGDYMVEYYLKRDLPASIPVESMWQWRLWEPETYESGMLGFLYSHDTVWLTRWSSDNEAFTKLRATGHVSTMRRVIDHIDNEFEVYRYDRLPEGEIARFENGMTLAHARFDQNRVDLWWQAITPISADYTVSLKVLDESGQVIEQIDRQPQINQRPTTTWQPEEVIFDPYLLHIAPDESVLVQVYQWFPDHIEPVLTVSGESGVPLEH